jgi:hypothetical protein
VHEVNLMKRFMIVVGAALLGATFVVADVASAFTPDLPSIYVLCKKHKAGKSGRLIARVGSCRKREVQINPADYPEFIGPQGFQGESGPMGPAGPQGTTGLAGLPGAAGPQGLVGPQGLQGLTGEVGPKGETGTPGLQGETGLQGPAGPQGPQGAVGPIGPTGDVGPTGPQGETGPKGDTGAQGPIGLTGPQGETGPKGDKGDTGAQGEVGPTGPAGSDGLPGTPGTSLAARVTDTPAALDPQVVVGADGTTVTVGTPVDSVVVYRVTFCPPEAGCDVSQCVYMATFQGTVSKSGNPHRVASSLVVDAAPVADNAPASVDVEVDLTNVLTVVFSLEAVCP